MIGVAAAAVPSGDWPRDARLARLEAVLLLAGEPLSSRRLSQLANLADGTEARTLVRRLNEYLDGEGRAFRVEEIAGGYQFLTRPKFGPWLRRLHAAPTEVRLTAPAMETLAVVAYRQPVLRAEIESIRGVQCGEVLRQLMERDLVRIVGRAEELGRPFLYGTTRRFLQAFGLRGLEHLPRADTLRRGALENPTPAPENPISFPGSSPGGVAAMDANPEDRSNQPRSTQQESLVTLALTLDAAAQDRSDPDRLALALPLVPHSTEIAADEDWEDEEDEELEDDEDEDEDEEEEDWEDDEEDDEEEDEEEDAEEEDLEDTEWEEVDDEEDEEEEEEEEEWDDEEEDEDWDDDEEDDDEDEEEEWEDEE